MFIATGRAQMLLRIRVREYIYICTCVHLLCTIATIIAVFSGVAAYLVLSHLATSELNCSERCRGTGSIAIYPRQKM